jgi:hypothetical protein
MADLREQGFLLNINKNTYKLTRKEELILIHEYSSHKRQII